MSVSLERAGFAATHADTSRDKLDNITRAIGDINASASEIGDAVTQQAQAVHDSKSSGDILIQLNQDALDCSRIHAVSPGRPAQPGRKAAHLAGPPAHARQTVERPAPYPRPR